MLNTGSIIVRTEADRTHALGFKSQLAQLLSFGLNRVHEFVQKHLTSQDREGGKMKGSTRGREGGRGGGGERREEGREGGTQRGRDAAREARREAGSEGRSEGARERARALVTE